MLVGITPMCGCGAGVHAHRLFQAHHIHHAFLAAVRANTPLPVLPIVRCFCVAWQERSLILGALRREVVRVHRQLQLAAADMKQQGKLAALQNWDVAYSQVSRVLWCRMVCLQLATGSHGVEAHCSTELPAAACSRNIVHAFEIMCGSQSCML